MLIHKWNILKLSSYGEAWIAAIGIDWKLRSRTITGSKLKAWRETQIEKNHSLPIDVQQITSAWQIVKHKTLVQLASSLNLQHHSNGSSFVIAGAQWTTGTKGQWHVIPAPNQTSVPVVFFKPLASATNDPIPAPVILPIEWRLFKLSPVDGWELVSGFCLQRLVHSYNQQATDSLEDQEKVKQGQLEALKPLTETQLQALAVYFDQLVAHQQASGNNTFNQIYSLAWQLQHELQLAGKETAAARFLPYTDLSKASYQEVRYVLSVHASVGDRRSISRLFKRLEYVLRDQIAVNINQKKPISTGLSPPIRTYLPNDILQEYRVELLSSQIAFDSYHQAIASKNKISAGLIPTPTYYHNGVVSPNQPTVEGAMIPFSSALFDANLAAEVHQLFLEYVSGKTPLTRGRNVGQYLSFPNLTESERKDRQDKIDTVAVQLSRPVKNLADYESKARRSVAAFLYLWNKSPTKGYELLQKLHQDFPTDTGIQIELARVAQLVEKHQEAIVLLKKSQPLESQLRLQKDVMLLDSAIKLEDTKLLKEVAERLAEMKPPWPIANNVSQKLTQNGLVPQAIAVLKAVPRSKRLSSPQTIQIANALHDLGETQTSAELAAAIVKHAVIQPATSKTRVAHGLSQALLILSETDQLTSLIEETKQQLVADNHSPKSIERLFYRYELLGMTEALVNFQNKITDMGINIPSSLRVNFGKKLLSKGEYEAAGDLLLLACQAQPDPVNQLYGELYRVGSGGYHKRVLAGLGPIPLSKIPDTLIRDLLRVNQRLISKTFRYSDLTAIETDFISHLVKSDKDVSWALHLMNTLPEEERTQLPEYRSAVLNVISHSRLFQSQSQVWDYKQTQAGVAPVNIMEEVLSLSRSDAQVRAILLERISKSPYSAQSALTAKLLKATLELLMAVDTSQPQQKTEQASKDLISILGQVHIPGQTSVVSSKPSVEELRLSQPFLRQIAYIIEATPSIPSKLDILHQVFNLCPLQTDLRTRTFDNTVLPTRLRAYQRSGQVENAIDELLIADEQTSDVSELGSSQSLCDNHLQRKLWIADQLFQMGATFEALSVVREELGHEKRLTAAGKLNRSQTPSQLRALEAKASLSANSDTAELYLQRIARRIEASSSDSLVFNLIKSHETAFRTRKSLPVFLLAASQAATTSQGQKQLIKLNDSLEKQQSKFQDQTSVNAAQLTIAAVLNSDQVASATQRFLASIEKPSITNDLETEAEAIAIKNRLAVLAALSRCERSEAKQAADSIVDLLAKQIRRQQDFKSALVLSERFDYSSTLIDSHITNTNQESAAHKKSLQMLLQLLRHSAAAADAAECVHRQHNLRLPLPINRPKFISGHWPTSQNPRNCCLNSESQSIVTKSL